MKEKYFFCFLFVVLFFLYQNALQHPFMMDDLGLILGDHRSRTWGGLFRHVFPEPSLFFGGPKEVSEVYYRPVAHFFPLAVYLIFGTNVVAFHLFNLLLFFGVCLSVFWMVSLIFNNQNLARLTALFFAIHPINGLIVNYKTASVFAFQIIAMSLTVCFFLLRKKHVLYRVSSFAAMFFAWLCHETALFLPFYLYVLTLVENNESKNSLQAMTFRLNRSLWPYFGAFGMFILFRLYFSSLKVAVTDKVFLSDYGLIESIIGFGKIFGWYLRQFLFMDSILLMWSTKPVLNSFEEVALCLTGFASLFVFVYLIFRHYKTKPLVFGSLWFLVGVAPVTVGMFFQPDLGIMIEPHWLYFASIGIFIIGAFLFLKLYENYSKKISVPVIAFFSLFMVFMTYSMNDIWQSEISYNTYWMNNDPNNHHPQFYLASGYFHAGDLNEAEKYFKKSLRNGVFNWKPLSNLALISLQKGDLDSANEYFQQALELAPQSAEIHTNLGVIQLKEGNHEKARQYFEKALEIDPFLIQAQQNLDLLSR